MLALLLFLASAQAPEPPRPVEQTRILRLQAIASQIESLQREAEIMRLQECSEKGIRHDQCRVDWQAGTVTKVEPSKPEAPKAEKP